MTILVCTYNGADRLPATLRCIAEQQVPAGMGCELLVVNNASTDNSLEVIEQEWQRYNTKINLHIITEAKPGLTFARDSGFAAAQYDYIILCDDDNWLAPDYVKTAFAVMESLPHVGILGGKGNFVFEEPAPAWLLWCNLYAGGEQAKESGKVNEEFVYGAGAVLRKSAYEKICASGFVPALTDRQGMSLSSGGDHELCYVLALAGYSIWYEDKLRFDHYITANRLTLPYYLTYIEESAHCFSVLEPYKILLKTKNSSMVRFRWELFKSFWYHIRKMGALFFTKPVAGKPADERILRKLQYTLLIKRLRSYRQISLFEDNFSKAVSLQNELLRKRN
ncbi:glycosyltransferase [Pseudoflavitalea rhizosphaerae]|uniref:glycosyltransferase n=1 Tax=Pseudoflavitalea rhizosphaerae TaxID=1884793 RepID=UPI0013DFF693|nr:glycosyltransferase [Pseudoflavitalea rhizosphaerae]